MLNQFVQFVPKHRSQLKLSIITFTLPSDECAKRIRIKKKVTDRCLANVKNVEPKQLTEISTALREQQKMDGL